MKKTLNRFMNIIQSICRKAKATNHAIEISSCQSPKYWVDKYVKNCCCHVVQIGSNDGVTGDPFYPLFLIKSKWNVLLVEPVPYLFTKLKENYPKSPRFNFENVAINSGTRQSFYYVGKEAEKEIDNRNYSAKKS